MIHADRTFCIKVMDSEDDLIEVLTNHKWSLCRAFDHDGLLYLNDGDREDAPEYAALKIDQVEGSIISGREVGRIRPLGMNARKVGQFVMETKQGSWKMDTPLKVKAEPEWHHRCELCKFQED
jgi:hypothetical protein